MAILDGNVLPIQFRLHDNRFPNSPKAEYRGQGVLRSDKLAVGEPTFDTVRRMIGIGLGGDKALSLMAANRDGELRADLVPLRDARNNRVHHDRMMTEGQPRMSVGYEVVKTGPAIILKNGTADAIKFGHGHTKAMAALLFNIRQALTLLLTDDLTNAQIDKLFDMPVGIDPTRLNVGFQEAYGEAHNLLADSEDFTTATGGSLNNATVTGNATLSPASQMTMDALVSTTAAASANVAWVDKRATVLTNTKYCGSAYFKQGTSPKAGLVVSYINGSGTVEECEVSMDWSTKAVTVTAPNGTWHGGVINAGGGFYRLWAAGPSNLHTTIVVRAFVRDKASTAHVVGETSFVWGAMANKGHVPNLYLET